MSTALVALTISLIVYSLFGLGGLGIYLLFQVLVGLSE